jgi:hypothetical protein
MDETEDEEEELDILANETDPILNRWIEATKKERSTYSVPTFLTTQTLRLNVTLALEGSTE